MVYSLEEKKKIAAEDQIDSPEGCGCKSNIAGILARTGVTHMIAGNMGEGAVRVLQAHGINDSGRIGKRAGGRGAVCHGGACRFG